MKGTPNPNLDQWWGYHAKVGWVVLDRRVTQNSVGSSRDALIFVRCCDWVLFEVKCHSWFPPLFIFAPNYLSALVGERRRHAELEWQQAREAFGKRRTGLYQDARNFKFYLAAQAKLQQELKAKNKQKAIDELNEVFRSDFLGALDRYEGGYGDHITPEEFESARAAFVQSWAASYLGPNVTVPDEEQAAAIAAVEGHVQVAARAGSGKTTTLVQRAIFLQKHCGVLPEQMLLLAFNSKAAGEVQERLTKYLGKNAPNAMTFHALAHSLVQPDRVLVDEEKGEKERSRFVQNIVDEHIANPRHYDALRTLLMKHYREDWESILAGGSKLTPKELVCFRRALPRRGIDGRQYKSRGEKVIADFLYEHGIAYQYERTFWPGGIRNRPDFTIGEDKGVVIEFFGRSDPKYLQNAAAKRADWQKEQNWSLLELFGPDYGSGTLLAKLKSGLEKCGVVCTRLSEEELWERINAENRAIGRFTGVVASFIGRCCKLSLSPEQLEAKNSGHVCISDAERMFLPLALEFYRTYLGRLEAANVPDFDLLIQQAAEKIRSGRTLYRRTGCSGDLKKLRYVFVDEYQDFSKLFYDLTKAIREQNPDAQFFCVGDDWQAINGFAGSDLTFYENFGALFNPSRKLDMSTNYRSATSIVEVGNALMRTKMRSGKAVRAFKTDAGKVLVTDLNDFYPTGREKELYGGDELTPALLRVISSSFSGADVADRVRKDAGVVLLSRTNDVREYINFDARTRGLEAKGLDKFVAHLRSKLPKEMRRWVSASTAHKYKGAQKDIVIMLDAVSRSYPLIHRDGALTRVLGDDVKKTIAEERRLFYVALTRAIKTLIVVTRSDPEPMADDYQNMSPFLEELLKKSDITKLVWDDYKPLVETDKRAFIRIGSSDARGKTFEIKNLLKAEGYQWTAPLKVWQKSCPAEGFSLQAFLAASSWVKEADGVTVSFYDDLDRTLEAFQINRGRLSKLTP